MSSPSPSPRANFLAACEHCGLLQCRDSRRVLFLCVKTVLALVAAWPRQGAGTLLGHSQVTVPFKGVLQRCDHNRKAMLLQSVHTAILADAETAYAIRQDLKEGTLDQRLSLSGLGRPPLPARPGCVKSEHLESHQNHKGCGFLLPSRRQVTKMLRLT